MHVFFPLLIRSQGWWDAKVEQETRDLERVEVLRALESAENKSKPGTDELFTDVYAEIPAHIQEQKEELLAHIEKYPEHYDLNAPHH
jgi:2-oxoisovalerate dehydrogenase E1 component alpha subunit